MDQAEEHLKLQSGVSGGSAPTEKTGTQLSAAAAASVDESQTEPDDDGKTLPFPVVGAAPCSPWTASEGEAVKVANADWIRELERLARPRPCGRIADPVVVWQSPGEGHAAAGDHT